MRILIPEFITDNITVKENCFSSQFRGTFSTLTGNLYLLLDDGGPLLELSWFIVVVDSKL